MIGSSSDRGAPPRGACHLGRRVLGAPPLSRLLRQGGDFDCGIKRSSGVPFSSSREAASQHSPRRKPWVTSGFHLPAPEGRKRSQGARPCRVCCDRVGILTAGSRGPRGCLSPPAAKRRQNSAHGASRGSHPVSTSQPRRGERSRWLPHPGRRVLGAPPLSRLLRQGGDFDFLCG